MASLRADAHRALWEALGTGKLAARLDEDEARLAQAGRLDVAEPEDLVARGEA